MNRQTAHHWSTRTGKSRKSIVLFDPAWHKGIIGIAASPHDGAPFTGPAVILTDSGGRAVGSARSMPGIRPVRGAQPNAKHLFSSFGGHAHAAGVQMALENVPAFAEMFEEVVRETLPPDCETPEIEISGELNFADITPAFWRTLRQFAPFGPGNMTPVFCAKNVADTGKSRHLANNHVRLSVRQGDTGPEFSGVAFGLGEQFRAVQEGPFELAFSLFDDDWHGERVLALLARGFRR
jgi:single-stranded-DNA-specific exonuclease